MRLNKLIQKILSITAVSAILVSNFPTAIYAADDGSAQTEVNVDAKGGKVTTSNTQTKNNNGDVNVTVNVDVDLVQRTLNMLDVAKFVNTANVQNQDYKPNIKDTLLDLVPEYQYADIVEYEGFNISQREPITVVQSASSDYAAKLDWLIDNNIINRTTYFMYDESGTSVSMNRTPRPSTTTGKKDEAAKGNTTQEHKYFYPEHKISKTDFLTELMKSDKTLDSRPILVQAPYKRVDTNLNTAVIYTEPIEQSPYTSELGKLGLDFAAHDIVADHNIFKQAEILVTNDVSELYLMNALNKNIISKDEIGGKEGNNFLGEYTSNGTLKSGYLNTGEPIRQFYDTTSFKLNKKIKEKDIVYPEKIQDGTYDEVKKSVLNIEENSDPGLVAPWGNTFAYNVDNFCIFYNTVNKNPIEIVKRPSIVEVNNGYYSYNPEVTSISKELGYEFFKKEEITEAEAYILAYRFMLAMGNESKLTDMEVEFINSRYSLNFSTFTEDERKATEYLIAKGVIDGGSASLYMASSSSLTNEVAVDLIYRIANANARIQFTPTMNSIDKEMATKGYAQATVSKTSEPQQPFDIVDNVTKGKTVYKEVNGEMIPIEKDTTTYNEIQNKDRVQNPSTYDLVYIRLPKSISNELLLGSGNISLITDDEFRIKIDGYNKLLNYGQSDITFDPKSLLKDEDAYGETDNFSYCLKDADGYYWVRYILHKSVSSSVKLQAFSANKTYTIDGIKGEGVYYVDESVQATKFNKIKLLDSATTTIGKRVYSAIVSKDLELRNRNKTTVSELESPSGGGPGIVTLWEQSAYADTQSVECSIHLGSFTDESLLSALTYNGGPLLEKNGSEWVISENLKATSAVKNCFTGIVKDGTNYYLQYKSPYQNFEKTAVMDVVNKLGKVGAQAGTGDELKVPGYAKIDSNGSTVVIIEKEELMKTYNIEIADGSTGRHLYNPATGQRGFINSNDNTTWIGNNVTQYQEGQLLVTATGEGTEKKVYYNLAMVMELINNMQTVTKNCGSTIISAICDESMASTERYRMIDIADVYQGTATNKSKVSTTYIASASDFRDAYLNLSAISGAGSNFIYYKNKDKDIKALLVYEPVVQTTPVANWEPSKGAYSSTASLSKMISSIGSSMSVVSTEKDKRESAKQLLLGRIMGISSEAATKDLLKGPYNLRVYILKDVNGTTTAEDSFKIFTDFLADGNDTNLEILQDATISNGVEIVDGFAKGTYSTEGSNITFGELKVASSFLGGGADFITHKGTGNFYSRIIQNKKPFYTKTQEVLDTRFYLSLSYNASGVADIVNKYKDYSVLNKATNADQSYNVVKMRYKQYYTATAAGYIPLEVFALAKNRAALGMKNLSGKAGTNFASSVDFKLTALETGTTVTDANVYLTQDYKETSKGSADIALATLLDLPYKSFTDADVDKYFSTEYIADKDKFLNEFYKLVCSDFDQKTGDYKIMNAVGNEDNKLGSATGWRYDRDYTEKVQFFQGMWYGTAYSNGKVYEGELNAASDVRRKQSHNIVQETIPNDTAAYILFVGGCTNPVSQYGFLDDDAIIYLAKYDPATYSILLPTAVKSYDSLPTEVKVYMDKRLGVNTNTSVQSIIDKYGVTEEVAKTYKNKVKIFYRPTIAVPAGTTLVKLKESSPTELILDPAKSIRTIYYPARNIINSALAYSQEKDNAVFLYQVPSGSKVIIGDKSFVKTSTALEADSGGKFKWVKCATAPDTNSSGTSIQYYSSKFLSEAKLLADYAMTYYNINIPLGSAPSNLKASGSLAGTVTLGSIMGPGSYRLPYINELATLFKETEQSNPAIYNMYKEVVSAYGFNIEQYKVENNTLSYNPLPYRYNGTKMVADTSQTEAALILTLNMPPSLQVKEVEGQKNTWEVVSYWDITDFNVSYSDEVSAFINSRDTEIPSVSEMLKGLKSQMVDGTKYTNTARDNQIKHKWNIFTGFVTYGIPSIMLILWLWVSILYVIISFNWCKSIAINISKNSGFDIISKLSFGVFSLEGECPSLLSYLGSSLLYFFALALLWGKYLLQWVGLLN